MNARSNILAAFYTLVSSRGFEHITVQDIIEEADVSRSSFYRLFEDKYALLSYYCDTAIETQLREMCGTGIYLPSLIHSAFLIIWDNRAFYTALYAKDEPRRHQEIMYRGIYRALKELLLADSGRHTLTMEEVIAIEMFIGGLMLVTTRWILSGMKLTPDELLKVVEPQIPDRFLPKKL